MENKGLLLCLEVLKKNTNLVSKTLFNASSLEVMVAMTRLSQKGNESYLKAYDTWLNEEILKPTMDGLKKAQEIVKKRVDKQ